MKSFLSLLAFLFVLSISISAQPSANDASIIQLNIPSYSDFQLIKFAGTIRNSGTDTIKSVTVNWRVNNGPTKKHVVSGIRIGRYQTAAFIAPDVVEFASEGDAVVTAWTSLPNGITDQNPSNDTIVQSVQVVEQFPEKLVLIEEITGAWCGYCPRAPIIFREDVLPYFPNTLFAAIHTGDGMTINDSKDFMGTYVTGVPTGFVDRKRRMTDPGITFAPEDWPGLLNNLDIRYTPVELSLTNSYDPTTRKWDIQVTYDFVFNQTANYRVNCYIIEDSLYGTGSSWDQRNFFNGSASEPYLSLKGAGDPIPGYKHHHVVRKMLGGSWGLAGVIPNTIRKGDRFVFSQTITADSRWNMANIHIVGILQQWDQDKFKRPIMNAREGEVSFISGTNSAEQLPGFRLFPNPVQDILWIEFQGESFAENEIQVYNSLGQELLSLTDENFRGSTQVPVSMKTFTPGIYFVKIRLGGQVTVRKVVKE